MLFEARKYFLGTGLSVTLHQPSDTILTSVIKLWPNVTELNIAGEQRQHLQAGDIRTEQGLMNTG